MRRRHGEWPVSRRDARRRVVSNRSEPMSRKSGFVAHRDNRRGRLRAHNGTRTLPGCFTRAGCSGQGPSSSRQTNKRSFRSTYVAVELSLFGGTATATLARGSEWRAWLGWGAAGGEFSSPSAGDVGIFETLEMGIA